MEKVNISPVEYHRLVFKRKLLPDVVAAGHVSSSLLADVGDPLKYLTSQPKVATADMQWGSMVDCMWLTPQHWKDDYIDAPKNPPRKPGAPQIKAYEKGTASQATIDAINFWKTWESKANGKVVVDGDTKEMVKVCVNMLNDHPIAKYIFDNSEKQAIFVGEVPGPVLQKGTMGKAMIDILPMEGELNIDGQKVLLKDCIVDLKQTHKTSEHGMRTAISVFEYHMRLNWYARMASAYEGYERKHKVFIFQNSKPPHDVHVRVISEKDDQIGKIMMQKRLDSLSYLSSENLKPLYDEEVKTISLPKWMEGEEDE